MRSRGRPLNVIYLIQKAFRARAQKVKWLEKMGSSPNDTDINHLSEVAAAVCVL